MSAMQKALAAVGIVTAFSIGVPAYRTWYYETYTKREDEGRIKDAERLNFSGELADPEAEKKRRQELYVKAGIIRPRPTF